MLFIFPSSLPPTVAGQSPATRPPAQHVQSILGAWGTHNNLAQAQLYHDSLTSGFTIHCRVGKAVCSKNPGKFIRVPGLTPGGD